MKLAGEIAELDKQREPKRLPLVTYAEITPQQHEGIVGVVRSYAVIKGTKVVGTLSRVEPKGKPAVYVAFDNAGKKLKLAPTSNSLAARLSEGRRRHGAGISRGRWPRAPSVGSGRKRLSRCRDPP